MDRPLVSFCLKSYNQKRYLKNALQGAFAQTYRPLEIVISDDGSKDGSKELILSRAREWNGGVDGVWLYDENKNMDIVRFPEKDGVNVLLLLNRDNLGNLGNWQRICEFANGELFVKADGDDISLPLRTEKIVHAYMNDGGRALSVAHLGYKMDSKGRLYGRLDHYTGAVSAYSRRLYSEFGPIEVDGRFAADDYVYEMRANILKGKTLLCRDRLVYYRMGSGVSTAFWGYRSTMARHFKILLASHCHSKIDASRNNVKLNDAWKFKCLSSLWGSDRLAERWAACRKLKSLTTGSIGVRLLAALLLTGRISDPVLNLCRIGKYYLDMLLWHALKKRGRS